MKGFRSSVTVLLVASVFATTGCGKPVPTPAQSKNKKIINTRITLENYKKIEVGMKETDLVALLGNPYQTMYSAAEFQVKFGDTPVDRLSIWKDESTDPANEIAAWIKNDQVAERGQVGLIAKPPAKEEIEKAIENEKEPEQKRE